MEYAITLDGETVGMAVVEKQGLFYCITCLCHFPCDGLYNIHLRAEEGMLDLGACRSSCEMKTRIPIKRAGGGELCFRAVRRGEREQLYTVSENSAFPYLTKLPQARLRQKNKSVYIVITDDSILDQLGSDQNQ